MTPLIPVAVAPNFHLPDAPADRLLVADGAGFRQPTNAELPALATDSLSDSLLLFVLPGHLCSTLWEVLEQGGSAERFAAVAFEVGRFLAFKSLPPPECAVFELVLHGTGGHVEPHGLWAIVNLGDDPVVIEVPRLRIRLRPREGCRLPEEVAAEVISPMGDAPDVLLLVRRSVWGPQV